MLVILLPGRYTGRLSVTKEARGGRTMNRLLREQLRDAMPLATANKAVADDNGELSKRRQLRSGQQRGRREVTSFVRRRRTLAQQV